MKIRIYKNGKLNKCTTLCEPGTAWVANSANSPCGLVKKHDGRIVDQFLSDGQSLHLTPGDLGRPSLGTLHET